MNVLVINCGSSSLKWQVIRPSETTVGLAVLFAFVAAKSSESAVEAIVSVQTPHGGSQKYTAPIRDTRGALDHVLHWLMSEASGVSEIRGWADIHAVGHRVVHGGELFHESALITRDVLKGIEDCIDLAPLHNPDNLRGILAVREICGEAMPQVAVFDTAFHASIPEHAYLYAVPYHLYRRHGIRRYGFQGTSHCYVACRYQQLLHLNPEQTHIVTLHLVMAAQQLRFAAGRSVDTSMGMTPLEGLVMGTRSGDVDPAVVNLIATKEGLSPREVDTLLNTQSGLLGVSGLTNDMKVLLEELKQNEDRRVRLAIEIFCHRARKYVGALLASMGGADAVVFTGGIGENSPEIRRRICDGLQWAGLTLDESHNEQAIGQEGRISSDDSRLAAYVLPTDEELMIALDTAHCVLATERV